MLVSTHNFPAACLVSLQVTQQPTELYRTVFLFVLAFLIVTQSATPTLQACLRIKFLTQFELLSYSSVLDSPSDQSLSGSLRCGV